MFNYIPHCIYNITQHIKHAKGMQQKGGYTLNKKEMIHAIQVHAKRNR